MENLTQYVNIHIRVKERVLHIIMENDFVKILD